MASFNKVILVGNMTRDVELRYIASGTAVTDIGLAINERVKKNNEWVNETVFVDVTLWGRTAEVASEYCHKGSPVLIEGKLKLDQWEQDGQKRSKLKIVGEVFQMLGKSEHGGSGGTSGDGGTKEKYRPARTNEHESGRGGGSGSSGDDSDIPF